MDGGEQPDQSVGPPPVVRPSEEGRGRERGREGGQPLGDFSSPALSPRARLPADAATLKLDDGAVVVAAAVAASVGMDRTGGRGGRVAHKRSDLERSCWRRWRGRGRGTGREGGRKGR